MVEATGKNRVRRGPIAATQSTEMERMRATLRWKTVLLAGMLLLPSAALAQVTTDQQSKTAPSDTVGPSELQNFSLPGNVTKKAEQQPQAPTNQTPAPPNLEQAPAETVQFATGTVRRGGAPSKVTRTIAAPVAHSPTHVAASPLVPTAPSPLPLNQNSGAPQPGPQPTFSSASLPAVSGGSPSSPHPLSVVPWLLAALALIAAAAFLLWRRHSRDVFAAIPTYDTFVPPEPVPAPRLTPSPSPRARAPQPVATPKAPQTIGIVSTRLRPSLELTVQPLRCLLEEDRVVLEFELELFNAGAAPARGVLAEASLFNAGTNQEQDLATFYAEPVGAGDRVDAIPAMKRMAFTSQIVAPRTAIQEFELGGRKAVVPLLAVKADYEWSGGRAQTSTAFLVGRETKNDKLGPLHVESVPREFRSLAAHPLPTGIKT